uniref:Membrane anchored junction protein n=1 Tax=Peromyscus maniculatus bairdii TaxID=230844 RepID=A0A8C8UCB8_PERMB
MSLKPFTYPFPETRFLHTGPNVYKFKIRYGDSIRGEEVEDKEVIIQELEDSIRAVLANMDNLQPFVTEHFIVFPYKSKWERVSHLKFKQGEIILTPYPFVFTLYVEMKWFTGNLPSGKPTDDSPLELVSLFFLSLGVFPLCWALLNCEPLWKRWVPRSPVSSLQVLVEKKAEEATVRKRRLMEEPSSPSRPGPHKAKIETSSEALSNQKPQKETKRVTQIQGACGPVSFPCPNVFLTDSKSGCSLPELAVPPLQQSNPPTPKGPGTSGFFGFLSTLLPFRYFFRKSWQ